MPRKRKNFTASDDECVLLNTLMERYSASLSSIMSAYMKLTDDPIRELVKRQDEQTAVAEQEATHV